MAGHKSPRAPSFSLDELIKKTSELYESNGKHSMAVDVAARQLGYSGAKNGSAARALASLKAFGLLDSNNKGEVAVSPDFESFRYTPDPHEKNELLRSWLRAPKLYAELLDAYSDRLPSDDVLRHRLIKMGFNPPAAEECLKNFRASVEYVGVYSTPSTDREATVFASEDVLPRDTFPNTGQQSAVTTPSMPKGSIPGTPSVDTTGSMDRILVRLGKGRRAWIEVPNPFLQADKETLKRQIDLMITDDAEEED